MIASLILGAALLTGLGWGVLWWRAQATVVDAQLETHKMMLPAQIRHARRVYVRGLVRTHPGLRRLDVLVKTLGALGGLGLVVSLAETLRNSGAMTLARFARTLAFGDTSKLTGPLALIAGGLVLVALGLAVVETEQLAALRAEQDAAHADSVTDLYWTPPIARRQETLAKYGMQGALAVFTAVLALSLMFGWLPLVGTESGAVAPRTMRQPAASSATSNSQSTASTSSSTTSSSTASSGATSASSASSTDTQAASGDFVYPIDALNAAALAPVSALVGLTQADQAALFFMTYWTLNGLTQDQIAAMVTDKTVHYQYHVVATDLLVFSQTVRIKGQDTNSALFYAWTSGEQSAFYNMANHTEPLTSLSQEYGIATVNGQHQPQNPAIRDSTRNMRQLVTAFATTVAYQQVQAGLKQGDAIPY
ncbi:hypothetical protein [Lacticaseibacillus daqingensis]|uniref:hypothetical protein n=1 Tax=Lacticaseibacillus daqingensis TaxID=2486014 RepID=UPI000F7B6B97|nr:hypothetical protein [Lacticaseibacillus daqingensis]